MQELSVQITPQKIKPAQEILAPPPKLVPPASSPCRRRKW